MKNLNTMLFGVLAVLVLFAAVTWIWPEEEATGATVQGIPGTSGEKETDCTDMSTDTFYIACQQWKANDYGDANPPALDVFSDETAREVCKQLEKNAC